LSKIARGYKKEGLKTKHTNIKDISENIKKE
jgi:hypothetical protein